MLSLFRQSGLVDQSRSAELGGAKGAAVSGRCQRVRLRQIAHVQRAGRRMGVVSGSSASHTPSSSPASRSRSGYPFAQRWTSPGPRRSSQTRLVSTLICKCLTRSKTKKQKTTTLRNMVPNGCTTKRVGVRQSTRLTDWPRQLQPPSLP